MDPGITAVERAFQLAATGRYLTVMEIKLRLHHEGYRYEQVEGPLLAKQLLAEIAKARKARAGKPKRSLSGRAKSHGQ
jgi:hypothetical protein